MELPENPLLFPVYTWAHAAEKAVEFGNTIFLTTGSYNLEIFLQHSKLAGKRIVVRVTKDSGRAGGTDTKIAAALNLKNYKTSRVAGERRGYSSYI